jgi:hypothetical protein
MRLLFTTVILLSGLAHAGEPLSKKDWALEGAFIAALLLDYGQTKDIKNYQTCSGGDSIFVLPGHTPKPVSCSSDYYETNPLLGSNPSDARIRNYFLAAGLAHIGITYLLPKEYRPYWQWGTLILELGYVAHNHQIGLKVDF